MPTESQLAIGAAALVATNALVIHHLHRKSKSLETQNDQLIQLNIALSSGAQDLYDVMRYLGAKLDENGIFMDEFDQIVINSFDTIEIQE